MGHLARARCPQPSPALRGAGERGWAAPLGGQQIVWLHDLCKYRESPYIRVGWSCLASAGGSASAERSVYLRNLSVRLEKVGETGDHTEQAIRIAFVLCRACVPY